MNASAVARPGLSEQRWATIVDSVRARKCTPFLGAGVSVPHLPRGADLASALAEKFGYPLDDDTNLARVTQFVASTHEPDFARRRVCEYIEQAQRIAQEEHRVTVPENHGLLAGLSLPIYVTTNYDDYLERALQDRRGVTPTVQICRWSERLVDVVPKYGKDKPTPERPLVFHLHGHMSEPDSVLVTEDDYIDFTVRLSQSDKQHNPVLNHFVRRALGQTTLLFVGYSLEDWNFRVLMRSLMLQQQVQPHESGKHISVQLSSDKMTDPDQRRRAEDFLTTYLSQSQRIEVYWGSAAEFLGELGRRVDEVDPAERRAS